MEAAGLVILDEIPDIATKGLAVDFGMSTQPRLHVNDAIPGRTVEALRHGRA